MIPQDGESTATGSIPHNLNLRFVTDGLPDEDLAHLSAKGIDVRGKDVEHAVQQLLDKFLSDGQSLAVLPAGPYCAPIAN